MQILQIVSRAYHGFNEADGWAMASHIALSVIMALFPFMIFTSALASFIGGPIQTDDLVKLVFEFWPEEIAQPIASEVETVLSSNHVGLLTSGILLTLFFASNSVEAVRTALDRAYGDPNGRSVLWQRFQSIVFVVIGAVLLFCISFVLVFVPITESLAPAMFAALPPVAHSIETLTKLLAFGLLTFVVYACHRWLPGRKRPLRQLWPGIVVTLILWTVSTLVFSAYVRSIANYAATYAGLAGIMSAQIFLYLVAVVLIFGAELNASIWSEES